MPAPLLRIGKVVRAVGLKGGLGVAGTDGSLAKLVRVALERGAGPPEWWEVKGARAQGRVWVLELAGIESREAAEGLVGCAVLSAREDLGDAGEGFVYWAELEGMQVVTAGGELLGVVTELYETGGVDVVAVTGPRGEILVPLAPYVKVEREAGRLVVDPPEGLLDMGGAEARPEGEGEERGG